MGGALAGEVAAQMAVAWVTEGALRFPHAVHHPAAVCGSGEPDRFDAPPEEAHLRAVEDALRSTVRQANTAIFDRARRQPGCSGMGTTLVAARWEAETLIVGHVGDSRAYRVQAWNHSDGSTRTRLERLSRDHDTVSLSNTGVPNRLLTRALGVGPEVALEMHRHPLKAHDWILLCSDGLTDMVPDDRLSTLLAPLWAQHGTPRKRARLVLQHLIDAALDAGGRDNITAILGSWEVGEWD
jgi:protein phosphatase